MFAKDRVQITSPRPHSEKVFLAVSIFGLTLLAATWFLTLTPDVIIKSHPTSSFHAPLAAVRAANAAFSSTYLPIAVFVGGTSGIGQAFAEAFARYFKGNAHIILCGRNRAAAESIIASFPKAIDTTARHEFMQCDAALMKNVEHTTSQLCSRLSRLNFLVLSPGFFSLRGREESPEGIDRRMALTYYARWKFTNDLLPLLQRAQDAGQDARVMSVLGAGTGGTVDLDDLELRKGYNLLTAGLRAATYNDLMIESFAERQPDMSFVHAFPGLVRTPMLKSDHWALRPFSSLLTAAMYPVTVPAAACAEHLFWGLTQAQAGASRRNNKGDDIGKTRYYGTEEARDRLWEHTVSEMRRATRAGSAAGVKS
ncbi:NAD-P-binding protein [Amylocystis lapponica]|nr:NAD-P-binding protein [Amylocystis lapponica]